MDYMSSYNSYSITLKLDSQTFRVKLGLVTIFIACLQTHCINCFAEVLMQDPKLIFPLQSGLIWFKKAFSAFSLITKDQFPLRKMSNGSDRIGTKQNPRMRHQ